MSALFVSRFFNAHAGVSYLIDESDDLTKITLSTTLYFKNETDKALEINFEDQRFNFNRYLTARNKYQNYEIAFKIEMAMYEEDRTYYPHENIIKIQEHVQPYAEF